MRLKIPHEEALSKIDELIKQGFEVLENPLASRPVVDMNEDGLILDYLPNEYDKWFLKARKILENIFIDFAPVYKFASCEGPILDTDFMQITKEENIHYSELQKGLGILMQYRDELENLLERESKIEQKKSTITTDYLGKNIKNENGLIFTDDGKLLYLDFNPIFNLSELQKLLCKELFSREKGYNHKTIDLEEKVYGDEPTKNRQEKFKKLVKRFNEIVKGQFKILETIRYGSNTTRRLL